MSSSPTRTRLEAGDTLYGAIVKMPGPAIVEICGHAGLDIVVIDTEHGPDDASDLERHIVSAEVAGIEPWVRIAAPTPSLIGRVLDAGVRGVVVPQVSQASMIEAVVRAAQYPPNGTRGLAVSTRAGRHGFSSVRDHVANADANTTITAQFEDASAIDSLMGIAGTPGLDVVWIGLVDISASLGRPGDLAHPDVQGTIERAVETILAVDGTRLCVVAEDEEDARAWEQRGARLILFSITALIAGRMQELVSVVRKADALEPRGEA